MNYKLLPEQKFNSENVKGLSKDLRDLIETLPFLEFVFLDEEYEGESGEEFFVEVSHLQERGYSPHISDRTYVDCLAFAKLIGKEVKTTHIPKGLEEKIKKRINHLFLKKLKDYKNYSTYFGTTDEFFEDWKETLEDLEYEHKLTCILERNPDFETTEERWNRYEQRESIFNKKN